MTTIDQLKLAALLAYERCAADHADKRAHAVFMALCDLWREVLGRAR